MTHSISKHLSIGAVATLLMASASGTAFAGKLERGIRTVAPLFERGTYAEFTGAYIIPDSDGSQVGGVNYGNYYQNDTDFGIAVKMDWSKRWSTAWIVDEPFGANINYPGVSPAPVIGGTQARLSSIAFSSLTRYKFDERMSVYAGTRTQVTDFDVVLPFAAGGYSAASSSDFGFGWVLGAAFEIPQKRVRASVTYHSKIEHDWDIAGTAANGAVPFRGTFKNQTPQGVDLEFQFPVSMTTLMYGAVHWADWSETSLVLPVVGEILSYRDDVWSLKLGVAQALRRDWIVSADVTYEFEQDEAISPFRTRDGEIAIGLASTHLFKGMRATLGVKYKIFNDNDATAGNAFRIQDFRDQSAVVVGFKLGYSLAPTPPAAAPMK